MSADGIFACLVVLAFVGASIIKLQE